MDYDPTPCAEGTAGAVDTFVWLREPVSVRRLVRLMAQWAEHDARLHRCTSTLYIHLCPWADPWVEDQPAADFAWAIAQVTVQCGASVEEVALTVADALATAAVFWSE